MQHYCFLTYGIDHPKTISTHILLRIIQDLICENFFEHYTANTELDLELHLQCIVASLRLLSLHLTCPGSGTLSFDVSDKLYNRLAHWKIIHATQPESVHGADHYNVNTEFLLVYAKDLIITFASDRSITRNILTRILAAGQALGHAVRLYSEL